ncbi:MAG: hypothetical protein AAF297_01255 [Planctomycetota bacterium]
MKRFAMTAAVLAAAATATHAQVPGDIIFVTDDGDLNWTPFAGGGAFNILSFSSDPTVDRLLDLEIGPDHSLLIGSGPAPVGDPSLGRIIRVDDVFGANSVSTITQGDPVQNPTGLIYDPAADRIFAVNNPGSQPALPAPRIFETVLEIAPDGSSVQDVLNQPNPIDFPAFNAGGDIELDPQNPGSYVVSAIEGGEFPYRTNGQRGSALIRINPDGFGAFDQEVIVDLSDTSETGLSEAVGRTVGFAYSDDNTIFVSSFDFDDNTGTIYRVDLDNNGDFVSITDIMPGETVFAEYMEYNPFSDSIVFSSRFFPGVFEIGLDGSGLRNIYDGGFTRGLTVFVPTPATAALLAGAGLIGFRRRR